MKKSVRDIVGVALGIGLTVSLPGYAALVVNGDFENGEGTDLAGWRLKGRGEVESPWRIERGAGVNGNRGLVWESADTNDYVFPLQTIRLDPGRRYRVEADIRTSLTGELGRVSHGAGAFMHWKDASGKLLGQCYTARVNGTTDWKHVANVTKAAVDDEAVTAEVGVFVHRGRQGRVAFDNVIVRPYEKDPMDEVCAKRFRYPSSRLTVDGKPFFPLGLYASVLRPPVVRRFAEGPFNCILPYNRPSKSQLDHCADLRIKVIYPINKEYAGWRSAPREIRTEADEIPFLNRMLAPVKDHPALLAWYVYDELSVAYAPRLRARRDWLEAFDPNHPVYGVMNAPLQMGEYVGTADAYGTDPYPVPSHPLRKVYDDTRVVRKALGPRRPLWQVPQAFSWAGCGRKNGRFPTATELRSMVWQAVAGGADGLIGYAFHNIVDRQTGEPLGDGTNWRIVCEAFAEVRRFVPVLLSDGVPPEVQGIPDSLGVRTFRNGSDVWVLVCNLEPRATKAELRIPGVSGSACPLLGDGVTGSAESLAVSLGSYGLSLVNIKEKRK